MVRDAEISKRINQRLKDRTAARQEFTDSCFTHTLLQAATSEQKFKLLRALLQMDISILLYCVLAMQRHKPRMACAHAQPKVRTQSIHCMQ